MMEDNVPVPSLIVAVIILAWFVPIGFVGAVFVLSRVIMAPRKWTRYIVEVHIALQSAIVLAVIVPMLLTGYVMTFLELPLPYGLILAQTLTMRISQWLMLVSATAMTVIRVRTAMYGRLGHSKILLLASVVLAWATGLGIGIGSTLSTVGDFQCNGTVSETDFECQAYDFSLECIGYTEDNYYGPVFLSVLLATSLIMLGGGLIVTRYIQSGMALAAPVGVFRTGASKNVLNDNGQLSFVAGSGISQDTVPPRIFLNNWVSEKKTPVHVLPSPKVDDDKQTCKSGKSYPPTPVQIRVVHPSTATLSPKLQVENHVGATVDHIDELKGTITTVHSEDKVCRIVSPPSVPRRQSRILNPIQLLSRSPGGLSMKEQKNVRYKQSVIRRFIVAFLVNVVTQIPYVVLQLAKPEYRTYKMVQPIMESISIISFALSTYIYVLSNTVIHKLLISTRK